MEYPNCNACKAHPAGICNECVLKGAVRMLRRQRDEAADLIDAALFGPPTKEGSSG